MAFVGNAFLGFSVHWVRPYGLLSLVKASAAEVWAPGSNVWLFEPISRFMKYSRSFALKSRREQQLSQPVGLETMRGISLIMACLSSLKSLSFAIGALDSVGSSSLDDGAVSSGS